MPFPSKPHRPEKAQHEILKDRTLEGLKLEAGEKEVYLGKLKQWHARHKTFLPFLAKLGQIGFWKNLETMKLHDMLDFMFQDRHFQSKIDKYYITKMKEIIKPESEFMKQLKSKKVNERRAFITDEITKRIIDGKYLEAEVIHMLYTMEAYNLKYLE